MNEWIIAPLLAADGTATHRPAGKDSPAEQDKHDANTDDRRHGDRRDQHDEEVDTDFARGEDRRNDLP